MGTLLKEVKHVRGVGLTGVLENGGEVALGVPTADFLEVWLDPEDEGSKNEGDKYFEKTESDEKREFLTSSPKDVYIHFCEGRFIDEENIPPTSFFIPYNSFPKRDE